MGKNRKRMAIIVSPLLGLPKHSRLPKLFKFRSSMFEIVFIEW